MLQKKHEQKDDAVSPVIGVMLMLVVTIIIAAAVAAFAGGITGTTEETPTIMAKTDIWSGASYNYYAFGRFAMTVESVSAPISTADLKLVTSWTNSTGHTGGNETYAGTKNTNYSTYHYNSPIGYGAGVSGTILTSGQYNENQWFGNYQLVAGTSLAGNGAGKSEYNPSSSYEIHIAGDAMDAILGSDWSESLKKGDVVTVQLVYIPTNTVIYNEEVIVR